MTNHTDLERAAIACGWEHTKAGWVDDHGEPCDAPTREAVLEDHEHPLWRPLLFAAGRQGIYDASLDDCIREALEFRATTGRKP